VEVSKKIIYFLSTDQTGVQEQTELKWLIRLKGQIGPFSLNIKDKLYEMTDGIKTDKLQLKMRYRSLDTITIIFFSKFIHIFTDYIIFF
jgi:hypothetical protein